MESGLEGRNNEVYTAEGYIALLVSMESGLEGRNNVEVSNGDETRTFGVSQWSPA